ncbi:hypothetical protein BU15DRAFT_66146 [Melanogaster broomeanus]|nr:hypothetical protein BU15DRAFT_66146 [Melanogaster broomeanus]
MSCTQPTHYAQDHGLQIQHSGCTHSMPLGINGQPGHECGSQGERMTNVRHQLSTTSHNTSVGLQNALPRPKMMVHDVVMQTIWLTQQKASGSVFHTLVGHMIFREMAALESQMGSVKDPGGCVKPHMPGKSPSILLEGECNAERHTSSACTGQQHSAIAHGEGPHTWAERHISSVTSGTSHDPKTHFRLRAYCAKGHPQGKKRMFRMCGRVYFGCFGKVWVSHGMPKVTGWDAQIFWDTQG